MTKKGKCEYGDLVLISGNGGRGWGKTSSLDSVYFEVHVLCLYNFYCAVSVQMTLYTFCCLRPKSVLTTLLLGGELWLT